MKRLSLILLEVALVLGLAAWVVYSLNETRPITQPGGVEVTLQLPNASDKAVLYKDGDGRYRFVVTLADGKARELTADEVAALMHRDRTGRSWGQRLLNVSNRAGYVWVGLGLLGQVLFTGRMVVQWLVSERQRRSTVPPVFWWMSLGGATMLMLYFLWRRDPIGLLGQGFGWFIYVRNLWLIYHPREAAGAVLTEAEAAEATVL
jgi:lipid-A-disaccharide synthase-like uncharacterized protein